MSNNTKKKQTETETATEDVKESVESVPSQEETALYSTAASKVDNDAAQANEPKVPATTNNKTSQIGNAIQKIDGQLSPYSSNWQDDIEKTLSLIENQKPFSYDLNGDILYHQYADQYGRNAEKAMNDTVGRVSSLSGGYGNSYAQTAGQQAYADTMSGLNDVVPQLYQLAQDRYNQERQNNYNMLSIYQSMDDSDYNRYIDDRNMAYQQGRDAVSDEQWQASYDYGVNSDLRGLALSMIGLGVVPDNSLLEKVGISPEQAQNMANTVVTDKYQMDYQEKTDLRNYVVSLLSSGVSVDSETLKKAGITSKVANGLLNAAKSSVSKGGGSGKSSDEISDGKYDNITYSVADLKDMQANKKWYDLYDYLSEKSTSYSNLITQGAKYGLTSEAIDYYNSGNKITRLSQVDPLLSIYGKKSMPSTVKASNALTEDEFYAYGNYNSQYNTYADYLTALFQPYLNL